VIPVACLITLIGCIYFAYVMFSLGTSAGVGGGLCVSVLAIGIGFFVYHDARRLLTKLG